MEMILFIGAPAVGKSTFYLHHFYTTHLRLNLDMLKTRRRESILLNACLTAGQRLVIDNTNPTKELRQLYINLAKEHHYTINGYYFNAPLDELLTRNNQREGKACIPEVGIKSILKELTKPTFDEGFKHLYEVKALPQHQFEVTEIKC